MGKMCGGKGWDGAGGDGEGGVGEEGDKWPDIHFVEYKLGAIYILTLSNTSGEGGAS